MAHINGRPDIPAGYFHASSDVEKTATARRASFNPSLSNRITNKFARTDKPKLARFVNSVRDIDLSLRQKVNNRRLTGARDRFEALQQSEQASPEQKRAGQADLDRLEHKGRRLESKQLLGQIARAGELEEGAQLLTEGLQQDLHAAGFVPLSGLRQAAPARLPSSYLIAPDGHRIKVNAEAPPLMARLVANSVSADYDRGASGASRALRSAMQHALVGVYSAEQSIKGMAARRLADNPRLDQGARARMAVRAERTESNRTMAREALGGNLALDRSYRVAIGQQIDNAEARISDPQGPRYGVHDSVAGIKPPQVRAWERRANDYFQARPEATPAADAPHPRRGAPIVRFAVKLATLHGRATHAWHLDAARSAADSLQTGSDPAARERLGQKQARHEAGAAKAQYGLTVLRSLRQGQLLQALDDPATRQLLDTAFPRPDDAPAGYDQPGQQGAGREER